MLSTPKPRPARQVLLALLAVLAAALAQPCAAQWKWRDAQGRVQYSDRPPPNDVRDRDILMRPAPPRSSAPPASAPAPSVQAPVPTSDAALEARKRQAESAQDQGKRDEEARLARQKVENCARAKEYARTVESGQRIARTNEKGEREFLDDAQRARESARAREIIASDCR
ncbi:DUF4124 domain-containing protein [Sphaerotilus sp.]|uniref:DUF4124 domain-containing protein n=1 Tax=Sphaerotilus sp. TaxID=2093942 RepID=UPI002ACD7124|nr:DUF4124 domain-containing protein [Sphaerotilus sp.]MDZ7855560.1 DUF4124 domain-containing protein [Sphaerotilus sp.]